MLSVLGFVILAAGFGVLLMTFFWLARLLAIRDRKKLKMESTPAITASSDTEDLAEKEEELHSKSENFPPSTGYVDTESGEDHSISSDEVEEAAARAAIQGGTFGLILGILACILFKLSDLMLVLSFGAIFYSGRALYYGLRRYLMLIWRALVGFLLGALSVGLHYLNVSGQLQDIMPF